MKIADTKECIMLARHSGVTLYIWGLHGIGKSSIVKQACEENNLGFIDLRCSQLEASDIRGFPMPQDGRTIFCPPSDMPIGTVDWKDLMAQIEAAPPEEKFKVWVQGQTNLKQGILFLDEINRAQDDVLQSIFQLVLDRRVGQYVLPDGWSVCAAGNYMEGYMVNGFTDPAFLDRFAHVILSAGETTLEEWVNYMGEEHGDLALDAIEFASQNIKHLDGEMDADMGFSVQPSRRSWDAVARIERACAETAFSDRAKVELIAGLVGRDLATNYKRCTCPVKPLDLLNKGVKPMHKALQKLDRNQMTGLMWGMASMLKGRVDESKKHAECAMDFAEFICAKFPEKDLVVAFMKNLVSGGKQNSNTEHVRSAAISNKNVARLLANVQSKSGNKKFISRLTERPVLQDLLSSVAWGKD